MTLLRSLPKLSPDVSRETLARLQAYADTLKKWQAKINLVSATTLPELWQRHFLDSAQLRSSVVSHAKELNYLPISYRSAKATVTVEFEATGESQPYIIPKGSQFSTVVKSQAYTFTLPENIQVSSSNRCHSIPKGS